MGNSLWRPKAGSGGGGATPTTPRGRDREGFGRAAIAYAGDNRPANVGALRAQVEAMLAEAVPDNSVGIEWDETDTLYYRCVLDAGSLVYENAIRAKTTQRLRVGWSVARETRLVRAMTDAGGYVTEEQETLVLRRAGRAEAPRAAWLSVAYAASLAAAIGVTLAFLYWLVFEARRIR